MNKVFTKILQSLMLVLALVILIGCEDKKPIEKIKVMLPSGTPLLAIGNLLDDEMFEFDVVDGQDPLMAGFTEGNYDLIIAPINLGAKLYLAGKSVYKLKAAITTNNTYLASKNEITSLQDVQNKKILAFGNGSAPSLALQASLKINNIISEVEYRSSAADVTLEYTSSNTDFDYFLLAEPNITTIANKTKKEINKIALIDYLKDEIEVLVQACLFVNSSKEISDEVFKKIENNIKSMNENPKDYASSVESKKEFFTKLTKEVLEKAIPNCNITYLNAKDNEKVFVDFYEFLNKYQPKVLNGKAPEKDFLY